MHCACCETERQRRRQQKKTTRLASLHLTLLFVQETNERAEDTHSKQKNTKKKSMKRPRTKKRARSRNYGADDGSRRCCCGHWSVDAGRIVAMTCTTHFRKAFYMCFCALDGHTKPVSLIQSINCATRTQRTELIQILMMSFRICCHYDDSMIL